MEAVRLRVKDVDFGMTQIIVRFGKGDKDRITTFPLSLTPLLQNHLAKGGRLPGWVRYDRINPLLHP